MRFWNENESSSNQYRIEWDNHYEDIIVDKVVETTNALEV